MIYVCDAIMGSGKSTAIINYMNDHPDGKYIYITPYLEEAARIKEHCPALNFVEPRSDIKEFGGTKSGHTAALINMGVNITSTHQALRTYTNTMLKNIRDTGYILVIDENIDMLGRISITSEDLNMLISDGFISNRGGVLRRTDKEYQTNGRFTDFLRDVGRRELYVYSGSNMAFWLMPPELITAFKDVYILTYLLEGQSIYQFIRLNKMEYVKIGVRNTDGKYEFCESPGDLPEYVHHLKDKIHVCMDEGLNAIGDDINALSATKYKYNKVDMDRLRLNLRTYFRRINGERPAKTRMWAVFKGTDVGKAKKDYVKRISDKGYKNCFIQYNARATNKYRDKTVLAYLVNVFMNLPDKQFYLSRGMDVDEKLYALSVMIQWIWRSGIRDGEDIYIYVPSRRMRTMLIDWINSFDGGGDENEASNL